MIENGERKISADIIDKLYELFSIEPIIWFSDVYTPQNYKNNVAPFPIEKKEKSNFLDKEKFSKLMRLQNEALEKIEAAEEKLNVYLSDKDRARIMQQIVISSFNNDDKEVNYNNVVHLVKFAG
jgi:transcriptional regulator with XRE-family HTH domain